MEWLAKMLKQDLESVARDDTDWDRRTGKVKRDSILEGLGDTIWGRSGDAINLERQKQEKDAIIRSPEYRRLERLQKKAEGTRYAGQLGIDLSDVDYSTDALDLTDRYNTSAGLLSGKQRAKAANATDKEIAQANDAGSLANLVTKATKRTEYGSDENVRKRGHEDEDRSIYKQTLLDNRRDSLDQRRDDYLLRLEGLDLQRQQESNKMDIYRQQLANQRADKKSERMMALISGLATLGSGFAL